MNILSIQSHVAFGHVGNSAAAFPMQRLGHEVWPIHTVQFSNHTGYGAWKGRVLDAGLIDECVDGIGELGVLGSCNGVLSGYIGSADTGAAILRAVHRVRTLNPRAAYCCDPVIGDVGRGVFVRPGVAEYLRDQAVPTAWIVTPNLFELEYLSGVEVHKLSDVKGAIAILHGMGPDIILVTSLTVEETPADAIDLVVSDRNGLWRTRTPKLALSVNGAGDAIAALFFVHMLDSGSAPKALSLAASSIYGVLKRTADVGSREILIVAAQDEFISPSRLFEPEPV